MKRRRITLIALAVVIAVVALWAIGDRRLSRLGGWTSGDATDVESGEIAFVPGESPKTPAIDVQPRSMPRIPTGIEIGKQAPSGWSHLVLHATPRIAEGDTDKVSALVARLASQFHLTVMAQVGEQAGATPPRYELQNVAIGLAMDIGGKELIVSSETQKSLGADLGFMERSSLVENEASLGRARQVARTSTMVVFDAAAVMVLDGDHRPAVQRHAVLVSPNAGRLAALVWLLVPGEDEKHKFAGHSLQLLPDGFHEDRTLHVDAAKFVLGVPTKEAFALVRLPQGTSIPTTKELQAAATSDFRSPQDATKLELGLRDAIGWSRGETSK